MDQETAHGLLEARRQALVEEGLARRAAVDPVDRPARAETRTLPYPFRSFITVTSDCDGPNLERWRYVGETFRETFALPIADSLFILWMVKRGHTQRGAGPFSLDRFLDQNAFLLRRFHRGWFDMIHGWFEFMTLSVGDGFELEATGEAGLSPRRRVRFQTPADWKQVPMARKNAPPRHLCLRYALPRSTSSFRMTGWYGTEKLFEIGSGSFEPQHRLVPLPAIVDLGEHMVPDQRLLDLEIEFELSNEAGHRLVVEEPMLVSATREEVARHIEIMRRFDLQLSAFSTHGIATALGARFGHDDASTDPRWLADRRENPHYFRDLFELAGVEFLNTQHNITGNDVLPLTDLLRPNVLNDGSVKYDFNRYLHIPRDKKGDPDYSIFQHEGQPTNMSAGDYLGVHIRGALEGMDGTGTGALVYTHAGFRCGVLMAAEEAKTGEAPDRYDPMNDDVRAALEDVADRYYDLSGTVAAEDRVFVAPTAVLLRLAQIQRHVGESSRYDREANTVHVSTWFDPVTRLPVPNPRVGASQLRWASFYVDDAATARLLLDGEPVTHLVRFPADETGKESIAVADITAPTVLFDEVPPEERCRVDVDGLSLTLTEEDAFRGRWSLRLDATNGNGTARLRPRVPADLRNHQSLRFAYRRLSDATALCLRLHHHDGSIWEVGDSSLADPSRAVLLPAGRDGDWHDVVLPYWQLVGALPIAERALPAAALVSVELTVTGSLLIDCLELLRDREVPPPEGGCLVGGRVEPADALDTVILNVCGEHSEARVTRAGHYVFEQRAPHGSVVEIYGLTSDGQRVDPLRGARHEALRDSLDYDFRLEPAL